MFLMGMDSHFLAIWLAIFWSIHSATETRALSKNSERAVMVIKMHNQVTMRYPIEGARIESLHKTANVISSWIFAL